LVQPADGFRRLGPDGIRDGEGGQHAVTLDQVDDALHLGSGLIGERRQFGLETRALARQQVGAAHEERSAVHDRAGPEPRDRLELFRARDL
jgi:hypothetical protein